MHAHPTLRGASLRASNPSGKGATPMKSGTLAIIGCAAGLGGDKRRLNRGPRAYLAREGTHGPDRPPAHACGAGMGGGNGTPNRQPLRPDRAGGRSSERRCAALPGVASWRGGIGHPDGTGCVCAVGPKAPDQQRDFPARTLLSSIRTARSAALADGRWLIAAYRNGGKTALNGGNPGRIRSRVPQTPNWRR